MLLNISKTTSVKVNDIVSMKMISGQEIIGRITDLPEAGYLTLSKPIMLQLHTDPEGKIVGVSFSPIMLTAQEDRKFAIRTDHILFGPVHPEERFVEQYRAATSSIEVAKPGLVV